MQGSSIRNRRFNPSPSSNEEEWDATEGQEPEDIEQGLQDHEAHQEYFDGFIAALDRLGDLY